MINPMMNLDKNSFSKINEREGAEMLVSQVFSTVLNSMSKNPFGEEDLLIPKSNTEKWFQEMLNSEYARLIAQKELKPLVNTIVKSFGNVER